MVDLSIHPNWARSSSSQRSMAYTIIIFGKPHEYSGPTPVFFGQADNGGEFSVKSNSNRGRLGWAVNGGVKTGHVAA